MGTVKGDIEIETMGLPFPFPIEAVMIICGKRYVIYKKEEVAGSIGKNSRSTRDYSAPRYITYLTEIP